MSRWKLTCKYLDDTMLNALNSTVQWTRLTVNYVEILIYKVSTSSNAYLMKLVLPLIYFIYEDLGYIRDHRSQIFDITIHFLFNHLLRNCIQVPLFT